MLTLDAASSLAVDTVLLLVFSAFRIGRGKEREQRSEPVMDAGG
jgi:hypothetical protein